MLFQIISFLFETMKKHCFLLLLLSFSTFAQKARIDSLLTVINSNKVQDSVKVNQLILLGNTYRNEKNYEKALKYDKEALALAKKNNFSHGILRGLRGVGQDEYRVENIQEAITNYLEAYRLFSENPAWRERYDAVYLNILNDLSVGYTKNGNLVEAQKFGIEGLKYAEIRKNYESMGILNGSLGHVARNQKDYESALRYFKNALESYQKAKNMNGITFAHSNLATIYNSTQQYDKAIEYHKQVLERFKSTNDRANIRRTYSNISINLLALGRMEEAVKYANDALAIADQKDHLSMVYMYASLSDIYKGLKQYDKSLEYANQCLYHAERTNQSRLLLLRIAYNQIWGAHLAKKDTVEAYVYLSKLLTVKDSLYTVESVQKVNELSKKYETEKKEQEIITLNKENTLKKQQLEQEILLSKSLQSENRTKQQLLLKEQLLRIALGREVELKEQEIAQELEIQESLERENILKKSELEKEKKLAQSLENQNILMRNNSKNEQLIRWLLLAGLLGLGAFGFSYYRNFQKQKAANALIEKQAEDLKFLMKEVHHRVKNNLQVVSAMLRMQTRTLGNDNMATNALHSAEERLKAIALLHEKLYKTEGLENVNIGDYIKDLMQIIAKQSHLPNQKFEFFVQDNVQFKTNLDTALPIGLLVNEVVNNAFKHAFEGLENPKIWIDLNKNNENLELKIKDNGRGLPDDMVLKKSKTLGFKLISLFTEQVNGTLRYSSNDGAEFVISFKI
jgi:two-component system, sensor histidine kinase PdtaS